MKSHYDFCRENRGIKDSDPCYGKICLQVFFDPSVGVETRYFDEICYGCPYFVDNVNG